MNCAPCCIVDNLLCTIPHRFPKNRGEAGGPTWASARVVVVWISPKALLRLGALSRRTFIYAICLQERWHLPSPKTAASATLMPRFETPRRSPPRWLRQTAPSCWPCIDRPAGLGGSRTATGTHSLGSRNGTGFESTARAAW